VRYTPGIHTTYLTGRGTKAAEQDGDDEDTVEATGEPPCKLRHVPVYQYTLYYAVRSLQGGMYAYVQVGVASRLPPLVRRRRPSVLSRAVFPTHYSLGGGSGKSSLCLCWGSTGPVSYLK
jgi:hypothetical protein